MSIVDVNGSFSSTVDWAVVAMEIQAGAPTPIPDIAVTPSSHDYGNVVVGGAGGSQAITVMNDGTADLNVSSTTLTDEIEFNIDSGGAPFVLTPGQSRNIVVSFNPSSVGLKNAMLQIVSNDPDEGTVDVNLTGTGISAPTPPLLTKSFAPDPITSGGVSTLTLVIDNSANGVGLTNVALNDTYPLEIVNATPANATNTCGGTLTAADGGALVDIVGGAVGASGSCTIMVDVTSATVGGHVNTTGPVTSTEAPASATASDTLNVNAPGGGNVVFEDVVTGGSTGSTTVSTATNVTAASGHLYLASIAAKSNRTVLSVSGLDLTWTEVKSQCGARSATGISVWKAQGTPSGDGVVTATLSSSPTNAVIAVTRYSGVNGIGNVESANTLGVDGVCSGGTDANSYTFPIATTANDTVVYAAVAMRHRRG